MEKYEDKYEDFAIDTICKCIHDLGLRQDNTILDRTTRWQIIYNALKKGMKMAKLEQEMIECPICGDSIPHRHGDSHMWRWAGKHKRIGVNRAMALDGRDTEVE